MEKKEMIEAALFEAKRRSLMTPDATLLLKHRITAEMQLPPVEFLFKMFGVPCFPRGELVAVTGKAKSGKTFFLSLLMAKGCRQPEAGIDNRMPALVRCRDKPLHILWYDTEQSQQSTQDILVNRILPMAAVQQQGTAVDIDVFNVRCESCSQRLKMFAAGVEYLQPDLVVLDGVRDLVGDINDGIEAQRLTEQLMALAQRNKCCMVCVLHQNKGESDRTMRGWIGTELTNKVFEAYQCEKLLCSRTFKVQQTHTRKYDMERELYYRVEGESGLPTSCDRPTTEQPRDEQGRWMSNRPQVDVRRLFTDILNGRRYYPFKSFMAKVMNVAHLTDKRQYYSLLAEAERSGVVRREVSNNVDYVVLQENDLLF